MRSLLLIATLFVAACTFDESGHALPGDDDSTVDVDAGPDDPTVSSPDAGTPDARAPEPDAQPEGHGGGGPGPGHDH